MYLGLRNEEKTVDAEVDYSTLLGYKEAASIDWRSKGAVTPVKN
jgi:hypothetical protein